MEQEDSNARLYQIHFSKLLKIKPGLTIYGFISDID